MKSCHITAAGKQREKGRVKRGTHFRVTPPVTHSHPVSPWFNHLLKVTPLNIWGLWGTFWSKAENEEVVKKGETHGKAKTDHRPSPCWEAFRQGIGGRNQKAERCTQRLALGGWKAGAWELFTNGRYSGIKLKNSVPSLVWGKDKKLMEASGDAHVSSMDESYYAFSQVCKEAESSSNIPPAPLCQGQSYRQTAKSPPVFVFLKSSTIYIFFKNSKIQLLAS